MAWKGRVRPDSSSLGDGLAKQQSWQLVLSHLTSSYSNLAWSILIVIIKNSKFVVFLGYLPQMVYYAIVRTKAFQSAFFQDYPWLIDSIFQFLQKLLGLVVQPCVHNHYNWLDLINVDLNLYPVHIASFLVV